MSCNISFVFNGKRIVSLFAVLFVSAALVSPSASQAATWTLTDANSVAIMNLDDAAGMYHWSVDGYNQLTQQWFWYRIGSGLQAPINAISAASYTPYGNSAVDVTYENSDIKLNVLYALSGGSLGSGKADMVESIEVYNKTGGALDFHLFQYSNFDLLGNPSGDTVLLNGDPDVGYDYAFQWKGLTQIAEAINSPIANHAEANVTPNTLNALNGTPGLVLNDDPDAGPGDVTWALQWDVTIDPSTGFYVFKDKLLSIVPIPEPSALALIALGLGAWGLARRRQS